MENSLPLAFKRCGLESGTILSFFFYSFICAFVHFMFEFVHA